jgi:hypothetical protein
MALLDPFLVLNSALADCQLGDEGGGMKDDNQDPRLKQALEEGIDWIEQALELEGAPL